MFMGDSAYDNISCPRGTTYEDTGCLGGQPTATQVVLGDHLLGGGGGGTVSCPRL